MIVYAYERNQIIIYIQQLIKLMSNYIHPMQEQYNKKVLQINTLYKNKQIELNSFISILTDHQIKFFSKDDVTKFSKLCNPFDKITTNNVFIHLELIYVHVSLDVKYFIVKYTGKSFKALNMQPSSPSKVVEIHSIDLCISDFKKKMIKIYGNQKFWFKALGGIAGTNLLKKQLFVKKAYKIFTNTCHSTCIQRFVNHFKTLGTLQNVQQISWQNVKKKLNGSFLCKNVSIQIKQKLNDSIQVTKQGFKQKSGQKVCQFHRMNSGIKVTPFKLLRSQNLALDLQLQNNRQISNSTKLEQRPRRRLKTLADRPKNSFDTIEKDGLKFLVSPLVDRIIHSKNRYNISSPQKTLNKCVTSLGHY